MTPVITATVEMELRKSQPERTGPLFEKDWQLMTGYEGNSVVYIRYFDNAYSAAAVTVICHSRFEKVCHKRLKGFRGRKKYPVLFQLQTTVHRNVNLPPNIAECP